MGNLSQDRGQVEAKLAQVGAKLGQVGPSWGQVGTKLGPSWSQVGGLGGLGWGPGAILAPKTIFDRFFVDFDVQVDSILGGFSGHVGSKSHQKATQNACENLIDFDVDF